MESLDEKLNALFEEWKAEIARNENKDVSEVQFTSDGLMYKNDISPEETDRQWQDSPIRVMFMAKDQNTEWSDDTRMWLRNCDDEKHIEQKNKNRELKTRYLQRIARILWAIHKTDAVNEWWFNEIKAHWQEVIEFFNTCPFAYIESKKQPGGASITDKKLREHMAQYKHLLQKEIDILKPNYIVCLGGSVFRFVVDELLKPLNPVEVNQHLYEIREDNQNVKCSIMYTPHPSARSNDEGLYEGWMYWQRDVLKNR